MALQLVAYYGGALESNLDPGALGHDFASKARVDYMYGRAASIYGGSNEVQRNVFEYHISTAYRFKFDEICLFDVFVHSKLWMSSRFVIRKQIKFP